MIFIKPASIVTCFDKYTIGTKVLKDSSFMRLLEKSIAAHDPSNDRQVGQHFIVLPEEAKELVSCGVARRTFDPDDYIVREHRERMCMFMRRERAEPCTGVAAVVYTMEAYKADPQVSDDEVARIQRTQLQNGIAVTHVLVAVLGFGGPAPQLSPQRFVENLAGGNNEALGLTADEIRQQAKAIALYDSEWCVVAD